MDTFNSVYSERELFFDASRAQWFNLVNPTVI